MTVTTKVTSAADIAAVLDLVGPDLGTPLADTPIWNEMSPRWAKMQAKFLEWEAEIRAADPPAADPEEPDMPPRPRKTPRARPTKGRPGSSTRRAANAPQAPTETPSEGTQPVADQKEHS